MNLWSEYRQKPAAIAIRGLLKLPTAKDDVGNGTKQFNYNSCNVANAMAKMAQLVGYSNAWVDNWPTY